MTTSAAGPATAPLAAVELTARERLLRGLAASIKQRGYRETKISDIVAHARTSRRTFYEVFGTKDECFLALIADMSQRMQTHIAAAIDSHAPWPAQVRAGVSAWIEAVAADPELSVSWIRELPYLGPEAVHAQQDAQRAFKVMLLELINTPEMHEAGVPPMTEAKATILLGGLRELAAAVLEEGGDITTVTEAAVDAAVALLGPPTIG